MARAVVRTSAFLALALGPASASWAGPIEAVRPAPGAMLEHTAPDPAAGRSRLVRFDLGSLDPALRADGLVLELFDDLTVDVERQSIEAVEPGRSRWKGVVRGEAESEVAFAVRNGVAAGIVRSPKHGVFRIRSAGDQTGVYHVEQIDPENLLPCAVGPEHSVGLPTDPDEVADAQESRMATVVDVLVGYTASARQAWGGTNGILSEIDLAIDSANDAYARSGVTMQLRLAHAYEVVYTEGGTSNTTLSQWRGQSDGKMDEAHDLRDDAAADVCCLLVLSLDACGIANLMTAVGPSFESSAFSVVSMSCAVSNFSFAHEVGHNMGCNHDRANSGGPGAYQYSYGYREPGASPDWRTIMSYAPGTRIGYFSNPNIFYQGTATGIASGASSANNAQTHNNTKATAAAWRDETTARPMPFSLVDPGPGGSVGGAVEFDWTAASGALHYTLLVATNPGLTNLVYVQTGIIGTAHVMPAGVFGNCQTYYWGVVANGTYNVRQSDPAASLVTTSPSADLNGDGDVDTADLGGLLGSFGNNGPYADLNHDGIVDTADIGLMLGQFGTSCQ